MGLERNDSRFPAFLIVRAGENLCALPLPSVVETMRPLPLKSLPDTPFFVRGFSTIRGEPLLVACLLSLLTGTPAESAGRRFVTLRIGGRRLAVSVDEVLGIRSIDPKFLCDLPPLLQVAGHDLISRIGTLDREFLMVLETGRAIPSDVWNSVGSEVAS